MPDGKIRHCHDAIRGQCGDGWCAGALKSISKATNTIDTVAGKMYHCIQMIPIINGLHDPDKHDPNSLPPAGACLPANGSATERVMYRLK